MTKCLTALAIKEMQIKIAACISFTPFGMANIKTGSTNAGWEVEKVGPLCTAVGGMELLHGRNQCGTCMKNSQ